MADYEYILETQRDHAAVTLYNMSLIHASRPVMNFSLRFTYYIVSSGKTTRILHYRY
jgi:hypothetical protein